MPPRFFDEDDRLYCEAGGRVFRVIDAGGQRWFVPVAAWHSRFKGRIVEALESAAQTFAEVLDAGVPIDEARQVLPGAKAASCRGASPALRIATPPRGSRLRWRLLRTAEPGLHR